MLNREVERLLPYAPEKLFDLAADVERYPEFLRWWISARIRKREGNIYYTDQTLGLGPVRMRFGSKTVLHRPEQIDVTSNESPFRRFRLSWHFETRTNAGCRVRLAVELELRSRLLQRVVGRVLRDTVTDIIEVFEVRARQLYGPPEPLIANTPPT